MSSQRAKIEERIRRIQEEIDKTQIHKHTEHHIGLLKAKIAKLRSELKESRAGRASGPGFEIRKTGDASVAIVGPPNVGKSSLLNVLTGAKSKIGDYAFTTLDPVPGVYEYKGARIQVLDLPGVIEGAAEGKGKGRRVLAAARSSGLLVLMVDVFNPNQVRLVKRELWEMGVRVDQRPPELILKKHDHGGVVVQVQRGAKAPSAKVLHGVLDGYGLRHATLTVASDVSEEDVIDFLEGNRVYLPAITVLNKCDLVNEAYLAQVSRELGESFVPVSTLNGTNLDVLREEIFRRLNFIRVYLKRRDGPLDRDHPFIIRRGARVTDVCKRLHPRFDSAKYALVTGKSVKFENQRVSLEHELSDDDIVTIV